jgi:hypothetical protein
VQDNQLPSDQLGHVESRVLEGQQNLAAHLSVLSTVFAVRRRKEGELFAGTAHESRVCKSKQSQKV